MSRYRITPQFYARITLVALILLVVIIVTGAGVRLTGSGLGCTDWPTCSKNQFIGTSSYHQDIEQANRFFTGLVSVAVIVAVLGALLRFPRRRDLTWLSLSLVLGVIVQAVLGGLAVLNKLAPEWVMAHFIASMFLIWAALVLHNRARQPDSKPVRIMHRDYIYLGRIIVGLTFCVVFVGTMVTGSGPHAGAPNVRRLGFTPHDITKVHGSFVWALLAVTVVTLWRINAAQGSAKLVKRGELFVAALLIQGAIGYLQYALGVPSGLVIFHIFGAVAVWLGAIWFNLAFYERYEIHGLKVYDGDNMPDISTSFLTEVE